MDVDIRSAWHISWFIRTLLTKKLFHFCRKGALCGSLSSPLEFPWPHPNSLKLPWSKQNLKGQTNNSKSFCRKQHQWVNESMQVPTNTVHQMFYFGWGCGYQKCTHDTSWTRTIVRNKLSTPAGKRLNVDRCHPHLSSHDISMTHHEFPWSLSSCIAATARYFGVRRNVKRLPNSTRMLAYISSSNKGKQVNYRGIYCIHWNLKHSKFFPPHAHTTVTTSCNLLGDAAASHGDYLLKIGFFD